MPDPNGRYSKLSGKLRPVSYMAVAANSPGRINLTVEVLHKTGIYCVHILNIDWKNCQGRSD